MTTRLPGILSRVKRCQSGTSSIEYGLILAFIVLAMFAALQTMAGQTIKIWNDVSTKSSDAISKT